MKETRSFFAASLALSLGAALAGCGSFSSGSDAGGSGGLSGSGGSVGPGGAQGTAGTGVADGRMICEILADAGQPCVAAHSTVRVLYKGYTGPLYQVCKGAYAAGPNTCTSGQTLDIGSVDGYADAASQDSFCGTTGGGCTISIIYDQTPNGNYLKPAPAGGAIRNPDNPAVATALPVKVNGHSAYGVLIKPGMGYRAGCTGCALATAVGTAKGDEPQTAYMVASKNHSIDGCCFDYGNAETTCNDDGNGTMEAVHFGGGVVWGTGYPGAPRWDCRTGTCTGNGPWVMADLENGLFAGWDVTKTPHTDQAIPTNTALLHDFVTGIVVGDTADKNGGKGRFALYGGDATTGALTVEYDGIRPDKGGYVPMKKQGSIILGIGGDNSNGDGGEFYEGVMASGAATLDTCVAIQANIVAAKYSK